MTRFYQQFGIILILACSFLLIIFSCKPDNQEIVRKEVAQQVAKFKKKYDLECQTRMYATAERIVDSLLLENAKSSISDSLRNKIPAKPTLPSKQIPLDTSNVVPLFDKK